MVVYTICMKHFFHAILLLIFIIVTCPPVLLSSSFFTTDNSIKQYDIQLNRGSGLNLYYTSNPDLGVFRDSLGIFYDFETRPDQERDDGRIFTNLRLFSGFVNMPNFEVDDHYNNPGRFDIEKSLILGGSQVGIGYNHLYPVSSDIALQVGIKNDSFLRLAYNLYDLGPSIANLKTGRSLQEVFSSRFSGASYSTFQNKTLTELGFVRDDYSLKLLYDTKLTDTIYRESSFGLCFSKKSSITATLAYNWASYDTINGVWAEGISAQINLERPSSFFSIAGEYRFDGTKGFSIYGTVPVDGTKSDENKHKKHSSFSGTSGTVQSAKKMEKEIDESLIEKAKEVKWDETILEKRGMSLDEIGAVLKANQISSKYDYSRVVSADFSIRTPEEYIKEGGICRDAANAVANILENNGYEAKMVYTKQAKSTPHAFVVTNDKDGSFYIFNFDRIYEVQGAENMEQAASAYSPFLALYLMDPRTHRVTDVVLSPDAQYLESISGIK